MSATPHLGWRALAGWAHSPEAPCNFANLYDWYASNARDGDIVAEVGVCGGRSIMYLARCLMDRRRSVRIYGVDSWAEKDAHHEFARAMANVGGPWLTFLREVLRHAPDELRNLQIVREDSVRAARILDDGSCALVLLDGDHSYEGCARDIAAWRPKVRPDGILAGDDFHADDFPGVVRAVEEAFEAEEVIVWGNTWISARADVLDRIARVAEAPSIQEQIEAACRGQR